MSVDLTSTTRRAAHDASADFDTSRLSEQANTLLNIGYKIGLSFGGAITLIYCGLIGHYPANVSLGDGLFFIATLLAFTFIYGVLVVTLYLAMLALNSFVRYPFNWVLRWRKRRSDPELHLPAIDGDEALPALAGAFILVILLSVAWVKPWVGLSTLSACVLMALIRGRFYKRRAPGLAYLGTLCVAPIPILFATGPNLLNTAMEHIGVRKSNATVVIDAPRGAWVARQVGETLTSDEAKEPQEFPAIVAFRGFGDEAVIEIGNHRFVIPNHELRISYLVDPKRVTR